LGIVAVLATLMTAGTACRPAPPPGTSHSPSGSLDAVTIVRANGDFSELTVRVQGWASDWDTRAPIQIVVARTSGDGDSVTWLGGQVADVPRPDVDAAFGRGAGFGFDLEVPVVVDEQLVCVGALNVARGTNTLIGCARAAAPPVG
jgi:hypothetical protein